MALPRPLRYRWVQAVLCLFVLGLLWALGCSSESDKSPPINEGVPKITVKASPAQVPADGTTTDITVTATNGSGTPGEGAVVLTVPRGVLDGKAETTKQTGLAAGKATFTYACNAKDDGACLGQQTITAKWLNTEGSTIVEFNVSQDASLDIKEAGKDAPPDIVKDTGPDIDLEGGTKNATISLTTAKTKIFMSVGDSTEVTATVKVATDAGTDAGAVKGEMVRLTTDLGQFTVGDAGAPTQEVLTYTDDEGKATVTFSDTNIGGPATLVAEHLPSGSSDTKQVQILTVQQITHVSTTCNGNACTIMGIKGSGFNEQAQVSFKVVDSNSDPVPSVSVKFVIDNPPTDTTVSPNGTTNAQGLVTANVSAGPIIGAFTVKAIVVPGLVEAESPTIGIRGAKASNRGFSLQCSPVNVGAYVSPSPPASYQVNCNVKVIDRYNNPVGTGTPVNFKVEAGSIPNSINTKKYDPTTSNTDEGTGIVVFSTVGAWPAADVDPLDADQYQFPTPRVAEPMVLEGSIKHNPRDGLVAVLVYLQGEEYFQDDNSNGTWDTGEMFIDQGEPFVDSNDNGVRDVGETYIDNAPNDGAWTPPNGKWDANTTIWTEARILYSSLPVGDTAHSHLVPQDFGTVNRGTKTLLDAYFADHNMNRVQALNTTFQVVHSATKGTVTWKTPALVDDFGFEWERRLMTPNANADCTPATPVCHWKILFYKWGTGYCGQAEIAGAPINDITPSQPDMVSVEATVLQVKTSASAIGNIQ